MWKLCECQWCKKYKVVVQVHSPVWLLFFHQYISPLLHIRRDIIPLHFSAVSVSRSSPYLGPALNIWQGKKLTISDSEKVGRVANSNISSKVTRISEYGMLDQRLEIRTLGSKNWRQERWLVLWFTCHYDVLVVVRCQVDLGEGGVHSTKWLRWRKMKQVAKQGT